MKSADPQPNFSPQERAAIKFDQFACVSSCGFSERRHLQQGMVEAHRQFTTYSAMTRATMRAYLKQEADGHDVRRNSSLLHAVKSLYRQTGLALDRSTAAEYVCAERTSPNDEGLTSFCDPHRRVLGDSSELLLDGIIFSQVKGDPNERLYWIPSSRAGDRLWRQKDADGHYSGRNRAYDRLLVRRQHTANGTFFSREPVKIQIKTSEHTVRKLRRRYAHGTLLLSAEKIAGGSDEILPLQRAVIEHSRGNGRYKKVVGTAYERLLTAVNKHIDSQQPTS